MSKIGIITYKDIADGKGRFLQAYALYSTIQKLGYESEIIDYYPREVEDNGKVSKIKRFIKNPKGWRGYTSKLQKIIMEKKYGNDYKKKRDFYEMFIKENIKRSEKFYGYESLVNGNLSYDAYVCGSDQIWNPNFQGLDPAYYLRFAQDSKRIAYAPSIGTTIIDREQKKIMKELLEGMEHLSVREKSSVKIISDITGKEVRNVLDPTLLMSVEWWESFAGKKENGSPYVLMFLFDNNKYPRKVAEEIARRYGYDIISIPNSFADLFFKGKKEISIGPERFVSLFKNASFVCTQSFHGVVLSLIYNREFYVFNRDSKGTRTSLFSRISDLLELVGLKNRIMENGEPLPKNINKIDFLYVNLVLEEKRQESLVYLKNALDKAVGEKSTIKLASLNKCTGCMACANICPVDCILVKEDDEGFLQPCIDYNKCISCGKCIGVCPILNTRIKKTSEGPSVYAVWSKDVLLLSKSTSGGAFGSFAKQILREKGLVYGAAYCDDLVVRHIRITSEEDLMKLHGSKYVQSEINYIYRSVKEDLDKGKGVLFSGTPCQISGLYAYLGSEKYDNLITCDLVCHGVPSPGVYRKYLSYLEEKNNSKLISINMRTKKRGWNSILDMKHVFENGTIMETLDAFNDPYMNGFFYDLFLRKACYRCKYAKIPRESDITLADYWGIGREIPFDHSTENGISLVLVNTISGKKLFEKCKHSIFCEERRLEEAKKGNIMLNKCVRNNIFRTDFFVDYQTLSFEVLIKKYLTRKTSFKKRICIITLHILGCNNVKRIKNVMKRK